MHSAKTYEIIASIFTQKFSTKSKTKVELFAVSLNYAALYTLLLRVNTIYIFSLRNKTFVTVVKGPLKFT